VRQIEEAGFYTPDELERLRAADEVTPAWMAAEALRLRAFLAALRAPADDFLAGTMPGTAYVTAVKDLAARFARMEVRRTPPRP
jgi:hypothetical protein